jgi:14-3-3 protein epsilon
LDASTSGDNQKGGSIIVLFQFYHRIDKDRVVSGGPWSFENHILVVNDIKPGDVYNQIPLNHE